MASRFADISEKEKEQLMQIRKSKSTNDAIRHWIDTFREFLSEKSMGTLEELTNTALRKVLEEFYICLRSKKSEKYKSTTLRAMCAALNRYFKDHRRIDITQDPEFIRANELFLGLLKENKQEGHGQVIHKDTITESDKAKLFSFFKERMKSPDPRTLQ